MDLGLIGRTALITGSSRGIGFAIARRLAKEGVDVFIHGRATSLVASAVGKLSDEFPLVRVKGITGDLEKEIEIAKIVEAIPEIDLLVNSAGYVEFRSFFSISAAEWRRMFSINVLSGALLTQFYLPRMLEKNWGRVVFISSESALMTPTEMVHYGMSKTAQLAVARGSAEICRGSRVTVNSVLPGPTDTEGFRELAGTSQCDFRLVRPSSIAMRMADVDEVASVVAFICSERASMINGSTVKVDGGIVRGVC